MSDNTPEIGSLKRGQSSREPMGSHSRSPFERGKSTGSATEGSWDMEADCVSQQASTLGGGLAELRADVAAGLHAPLRTLPAKYLYDARGSELYEDITRLPEYYPFRTERRILQREASTIIERSCPEAIVELGSGSSVKTRILLDALDTRGLLKGYGAVEISETALMGALDSLAGVYGDIRLEGVVGDFNKDLTLPFPDLRKLVLFLGSTIGNLADAEAVALLRGVAEAITPGDRLLVGFDLIKDVGVIEAAYNDGQGVTAAFNLNILRRLNRELGADFDLEAFRHSAFFNESESRIEMHVVSTRFQSVDLGTAGEPIAFRPGDSIRTEISRKFSKDQVESLVTSAGLRIEEWLTDEKDHFAVALLAPQSYGAGFYLRRPGPGQAQPTPIVVGEVS